MQFDGPHMGQKLVEMIKRLDVANRITPGCAAQFGIVRADGRQYRVTIVEVAVD